MSSGRIQLTSVGLQDEFLSGTPDVTYFVKKFNRHTKFSLETLDVPFFQTNIDFGSWVNVTIPRNGQLIRNLYLKLVLPSLTVGGYTNGIGNAIIEYADLLIGGQTIERINGEFMQIYDQSFISDSQQPCLTYMVGTTPGNSYALGPATAYQAGIEQPAYGFYPRTFIVPLPFYFMRNEALSIPLCALTRQEVEVRIQLRPLQDVIAGGSLQSPLTVTTSISWIAPSPENPNTLGANFSSVTWLGYSFVFVCLPTTKLTPNQFYYYDFNQFNFVGVSRLPNFTGPMKGVAQNNTGVILLVASGVASSNSSSSTPAYRAGISFVGLATAFAGLNDPVGRVVDYTAVASDGTNFVAVGNFVGASTTFAVVTFSSPLFVPTLTTIATSARLGTIAWSPAFNAYIIGDTTTRSMYSYTIGSTALNLLVNTPGPYTAYSTEYGQLYSNSPLACSDSVISNVYVSSLDGGVTYPYPLPTVVNSGVTKYPTGIAYSPSLNLFFTFINQTGAPSFSLVYYVSSLATSTTLVTSAPIDRFQASLPVEYVFLADEEVQYIQGAKIDYVITQLQEASTSIPAGATSLNGYRLNFVNPVKELFFCIQDSNVAATNDYWNYLNTSTGTQQLQTLQYQFNGEDVISPTIANDVYLGYVQFLNNHTRRPDMDIYNYSFSIDPENYIPTGQVNMSRIMNQNMWLTLTPNPRIRNVRVYGVGYNILRVQNGIAGVLFIDNNMSVN
jgi:hypothetical protein